MKGYNVCPNGNESLIVYFQPADYWLRVHSLKSLNDGGILDFDDRLSDVTDDREQVIKNLWSNPSPSPEQTRTNTFRLNRRKC